MASSRNAASGSVSSRRLPVPASPQSGRRRNPEIATAVLQAAVELLDNPRVGFRGLTMQAVAQAAGVSKATLYRWWPDKAHLVLDAYRSKSARDVTSPVTGEVGPDLVAHLGQLAYALNFLDSARTVAAITLAAAEDERFGALYRDTLLRERRQALLEILIAGRRRGDVRAGVDLDIVVDAAIGAIHHRLLLTRAPIDGPFVSALADFILDGVRNNGIG
jgi:AcrR family transcriptional regulator